MRRGEFEELVAFATIAERASFARAAEQLRVSPSALSQTIRGLEERLGVRLLNRTTRSVAPSEAGARLLKRLGPALTELDAAVADVRGGRDQPTGAVRLTIPGPAAQLVGPLLGGFCRAYPDVQLEVLVEDSATDIVAGRFDAGIRLGEQLPKDMVAMRLTGDLELMAVASPEYLAAQGIPSSPRDLRRHRCINYRWPQDGGLYRWEFQRGGTSFQIAVDGPLVTNDPALLLRAALDGAGVAYLFGPEVAAEVEAGRLERVLAAWSPRFPGFHLYYTSRRHLPPGLRAFVGYARSELRAEGRWGRLPQRPKPRS